MIPNSRWFPMSLADRSAWFDNFDTQFQFYAGALGLNADIAGVTADNADFQSIAATTLAVQNFASAVTQFRRELTEGDIGDPQPVFPAEDFEGPPNEVAAGIFQRLDELRDRILAAPAYTDAMGIAMGIVATGGGEIDPLSVQPEIELFAAETGYLFTVVVIKRANADFWIVRVAPVGSTNWQNMGSFTGKSTDINWPPPEESLPVQLQVRVQLRKNNADYGDPSNISLVTVNP